MHCLTRSQSSAVTRVDNEAKLTLLFCATLNSFWCLRYVTRPSFVYTMVIDVKRQENIELAHQRWQLQECMLEEKSSVQGKTSLFVLAEVSVWLTRKLFILIVQNNIDWIKESQKYVVYFWKQKTPVKTMSDFWTVVASMLAWRFGMYLIRKSKKSQVDLQLCAHL